MRRLEDMRRAALEYSIAQAPIFSGLPADDLRRISSYASLRSLRRDAYLFRQKETVFGFFIVRQGLINVHRINAQGREQVVHLLRPGDSFAERAITSTNGYPVNARAAEDSEVIVIPAEEFKNHLHKKPDLAWRMVSSMSDHLRALVSALEGLRFKDIEMRLIHWLLQRCPDTQSDKAVDIVLGTTKGELAVELATRQETLSRTFGKLREAGYIKVRSKLIVVLHPAKLQEYFSQRRS
jgi:CRP-like cAMP-binding protein